nr:reverse transcriptase domain-containing protein [Tanacetum cinerariifolium]
MDFEEDPQENPEEEPEKDPQEDPKEEPEEDLQGDPEIMPPKMMKQKAIKKMVKRRIAKAIEEYEKTRANPGNVGRSRPAHTRGTMNMQCCSHKTFMNEKPHPFNGTKGVVGLRRWIEKIEKVFEICKCAEEDKVMFDASTFEGRALTW